MGFRIYHLICATLVCLTLFLLNKKLLLDTDTRKASVTRAVTYTQRQVASKDDNQITTHSDVLGQRLLRVTELCQRTKHATGQASGTSLPVSSAGRIVEDTGSGVTGKVREITGSAALKFAYCVVPKAGCTMWLRVLQFLAGQGRREAGPMSLSKHDIHYKGLNFKRDFKMKDNSSFIESSLRSMTVRDPYTRLWSAYIDKLILPDFWVTKGKMIIRLHRQNPSPNSLKCGHDVTFKEFIAYVIKIGHDATYINQDKHWLPASDICDPCKFKPEVVGKQETFMADFKYTVNRLERNDILESVVTLDPVVFEIEDEIDYNFNIYHHHARCASVLEICRKMWTAFQFNGYLPPSENFEAHIKSNASTITKNQFLSVIREVRNRFNVTKADKVRWRKESIAYAFSTISDSQKEALMKLYQRDFELFAYDPKPDYLGVSSVHTSSLHFTPP